MGSTDPICRLADPPAPTIQSHISSTASKDQSPPFIKVDSDRESRLSHAMDLWAHRVAGGPYKRTPRPPPERHPIHLDQDTLGGINLELSNVVD